MRVVGSWIMRLIAVGLMVAMWFVSPYMLHSTNHVLNVVELLGWAFGLLMVTLLAVGSFAVRKPIRLQNPPQRPAPAPSGIMQPLCERCAIIRADTYSVSKDVLLCVKCATTTPGEYGMLYSAAYGINARITGSRGLPVVATNPAK